MPRQTSDLIALAQKTGLPKGQYDPYPIIHTVFAEGGQPTLGGLRLTNPSPTKVSDTEYTGASTSGIKAVTGSSLHSPYSCQIKTPNTVTGSPMECHLYAPLPPEAKRLWMTWTFSVDFLEAANLGFYLGVWLNGTDDPKNYYWQFFKVIYDIASQQWQVDYNTGTKTATGNISQSSPLTKAFNQSIIGSANTEKFNQIIMCIDLEKQAPVYFGTGYKKAVIPTTANLLRNKRVGPPESMGEATVDIAIETTSAVYPQVVVATYAGSNVLEFANPNVPNGSVMTWAVDQTSRRGVNFTVDASTDVITTAIPHGLTAGMAFGVTANTADTLPAGLTRTTYYAGNITSTTLQAFTTSQGAQAGGAGFVDITTTGTGTFGLTPSIAGLPSRFTITADSAADTITCNNHGLKVGQAFRMSNAGGALPTGISAITYFAGNITANNFKAYTTQAGAYAGITPVDITANGSGINSVTAWLYVSSFPSIVQNSLTQAKIYPNSTQSQHGVGRLTNSYPVGATLINLDGPFITASDISGLIGSTLQIGVGGQTEYTISSMTEEADKSYSVVVSPALTRAWAKDAGVSLGHYNITVDQSSTTIATGSCWERAPNQMSIFVQEIACIAGL